MSKPISNEAHSLTKMNNLNSKPSKWLGMDWKRDHKPDVAAKSGGLFDQLKKGTEPEMKGNGAGNGEKSGLVVDAPALKGNSENKGLFGINQGNSTDGKNDSESGEMELDLCCMPTSPKKSSGKVQDPKSEEILEAKNEIPNKGEDRVNGSQKSENLKIDLGNSVKNLDKKMTSPEFENNYDCQLNYKGKHSKKGNQKREKDSQNKPNKTHRRRPSMKQRNSRRKRRERGRSQPDHHIYLNFKGLYSSHLAQPNNNNTNSNVQNNTVKILSERQNMPSHRPAPEQPNDPKKSIPNTTIGPSMPCNIQPDQEDQMNQRSFTFGNIKRTSQGQDLEFNVGIDRQNDTDSRPQNKFNNSNENVNPQNTYHHNVIRLQEPTERRVFEASPRVPENVFNGRVSCSPNKSFPTSRPSHHSRRNVNPSNTQYANNYSSQQIRIEPSNINNYDRSRMEIISSRPQRTNNPQLSSYVNVASNFLQNRPTYISNYQNGEILGEVDILWKKCEQCNVLYYTKKIGDEWVNRHEHDHYANVTMEGGRLLSKAYGDFTFFRNESPVTHDRPRSVRIISGRGSQRNVERDGCDKCQKCGRGLGVSDRYIVNDHVNHNNNHTASNLNDRSGRAVNFQNHFIVSEVPQISQRDRIKICPNCYQNQVVERIRHINRSVEKKPRSVERRSNPVEVSHTHQHDHRHLHTTKGPAKTKKRKRDINWRRTIPNEMLSGNGEQPVEEENCQNQNRGDGNNENLKYGWTDNELPNSLIRPNHLVNNPTDLQPATLEGDYQNAHFENQNSRSNFGEGDQNYHRNILSAVGESPIPRNGNNHNNNPNVHQNPHDSRNSSRPLEIVEDNPNNLNLGAISEKVSQEMISTSNNDNLESKGKSRECQADIDNDDNVNIENEDQIKEVKNEKSNDLVGADLNNTNENNIDNKENKISSYQQEEFDQLRRELSEMKKMIRKLISSKTKQSSDDTSSKSDKQSGSEKKERKPKMKNKRPFESTIKINEKNRPLEDNRKVFKKKRSNNNKKHNKNNRQCVRHGRNCERAMRRDHHCRAKRAIHNSGVSLTMHFYNNEYSTSSYTSEMESINRVERDFQNFNCGSSSQKEHKVFMKKQKINIQSITSSIMKSSSDYKPVHDINKTHSDLVKNYIQESLEDGKGKESDEHGKFI